MFEGGGNTELQRTQSFAPLFLLCELRASVFQITPGLKGVGSRAAGFAAEEDSGKICASFTAQSNEARRESNTSTSTRSRNRKGIEMNDKEVKGQRNLKFLSWMGLTCHAFGVVFAFGSMISVFNPDSAWRGIISGMVMVVFGMALSGWAGNLSEISALKKRVLTLEQQAETD